MSKPSDSESRVRASSQQSAVSSQPADCVHPGSALLPLLRRPFVRDVGVLQIGSLASLGVSFLLSVALARVLGRDGYGAYALVISTMTTISLFKRLGQDYIVTTRLAAAYARYDSLEIRAALTTFNSINLWSTLL